MSYNPWAVDDARRHRLRRRSAPQLPQPAAVGDVIDPRTRDTASFTYAASDAGGTSAPATVRVAIVPANRAARHHVDATDGGCRHRRSGRSTAALLELHLPGRRVSTPTPATACITSWCIPSRPGRVSPNISLDPATGVLHMFTGPCGRRRPCEFGPDAVHRRRRRQLRRTHRAVVHRRHLGAAAHRAERRRLQWTLPKAAIDAAELLPRVDRGRSPPTRPARSSRRIPPRARPTSCATPRCSSPSRKARSR